MKVFVHLDYREEKSCWNYRKATRLQIRFKTFVRKNNQSHKNLADTAQICFFNNEAGRYGEALEGQSITGAVFRGGMVEINTEDSLIVFYDGAYPRYCEDRTKFPKKHQFAIYFDDETGIFVSIQMYGESPFFQKENAQTTIIFPLAQNRIRLTDGLYI